MVLGKFKKSSNFMDNPFPTWPHQSVNNTNQINSSDARYKNASATSQGMLTHILNRPSPLSYDLLVVYESIWLSLIRESLWNILQLALAHPSCWGTGKILDPQESKTFCLIPSWTLRGLWVNLQCRSIISQYITQCCRKDNIPENALTVHKEKQKQA